MSAATSRLPAYHIEAYRLTADPNGCINEMHHDSTVGMDPILSVAA